MNDEDLLTTNLFQSSSNMQVIMKNLENNARKLVYVILLRTSINLMF